MKFEHEGKEIGFEPEPIKLPTVEELIRGAMEHAPGVKLKGKWAHALNVLKTRGEAAAMKYLFERKLLTAAKPK